ncbi:ras interacting protein [Tieghemostelium lacteum]|uniref:Ras interacting protein n=1 Tax=Tieghemostelium lacteum TaxID=361077 RepID=A0A151ZS97_TIELA|nr:ras interacting protein [Tieghemostelium lacteum]|eukprot:KYQ96812.1 ras interacting protein [Tieghemostelium lacteum]
MATFCELDEVVLQIRNKTQIFYETFKRDSIAEQLYNFSNDNQDIQDPDTPYSKSLERDFSNLMYLGGKNVNSNTTPNNNNNNGHQSPMITISPPQQTQQQQQQQQQANNKSNPNSQTNSNVSSATNSSSTTTSVSSTSSATSTVSSTTSTSTVSSNSSNNTTTSTNTSSNSSNTSQPTQQQPTQTSIAPPPPTNNQTNNNNYNEKPQCKIVTFSGTSVKLNKSLNQKSNNLESQQQQQQTQVKPNTTTNNTNGTVTITTETTTITTNPNAPVFVFVKEQIPVPTGDGATQVKNDSLLTRLVRPNSDQNRDEMFLEYGDVTPPVGTNGIVIGVHPGIPGVGVIKVKIIEKATVIQTIAAVLKSYFASHPLSGGSSPTSLSPNSSVSSSSTGSSPGVTTSPLIPDPKAYFLRIAQDSEGRIDEDYPTLDPNQLIYKFRDEIFVLCFNPKYEGHKKRASWSNNSTTKSGSGNTLQPGGAYEKGHHRRVSGSVGGGDSLLVVKITLPDGSITKVAYQPDTKLKELLMNTCKKRKLTFTDHHFTLENGVSCNLNMTMEQLGSVDLVLATSNHRRSMIIDPSLSPLSGDDGSGGADQQQEIFWYDALAWQYKTYEVTKLKKYGSKQERILGIDRERITNMSPKEQETKRPARLIKDVSKIALVEQKPKNFTIEYIDGKSYIYETKSQATAIEVVGKISYILGK